MPCLCRMITGPLRATQTNLIIIRRRTRFCDKRYWLEIFIDGLESVSNSSYCDISC
jgi:hypothetical protein